MDLYENGLSQLDADVANSGWLSHLRKILSAANRVVHLIEHDGTSILLHWYVFKKY